MSAQQFILPGSVAFSNGIPAAGGTITFYLAGTTTKSSVYTTSALDVAHPNPITANGAGRFPQIYMDTNRTYRVIIQDASGNTLDDIDNFIPGTAYSVPGAPGTNGLNGAPGAPGTPGVNGGTASNLTVGLFTGCAGQNLTAGGTKPAPQMVWTSGYSIVGVGAAAYYLDNTNVDAAYVTANPRTSFRDSQGNGYRLVTALGVTPYQLGAVGWNGNKTTSTDDSAALQALFDLWTNNAGIVMDATGVFVIRNPLLLGGLYGNGSLHIKGNLRLWADAAMDTMLTFNKLKEMCWNGKLEYFGTSTGVWAGRTVGTGLLLKQCFANVFPSIYAEEFKYYGLNTLASAGSPNNVFPRVRINNCGSGIVGSANSLTSTWNTPVNTGSLAGGDQRSTIHVGTMFPLDYISTHNEGSINQSQLLVRIGSQYYQVKEYSTGLGTISICPFLEPSQFSAGSGTLTYVIGAASRMVGGDSDVNTILSLNTTGNGRGHVEQCLYGNSILELHSSANGIALSLSSGPGNIHWGSDIGQYYGEQNDCDLMLGGTLTWSLIRGTMELDWSKIKFFPTARLDASTASDHYPYQQFDGVTIGYQGKFYSLEKARRNDPFNSYQYALACNGPYKKTVFKVTGAASWYLPLPKSEDKYKNDVFGYDSCGLLILGDGTNHTPSGNQVFYRPSSAYTINGVAADLTFNTARFKGPAEFVIMLNYDTSDYTIELVGGA